MLIIVTEFCDNNILSDIKLKSHPVSQSLMSEKVVTVDDSTYLAQMFNALLFIQHSEYTSLWPTEAGCASS